MQSGKRLRVPKITSESFAAVIRAYMTSPKFTSKSPATQRGWGRELLLAEETLGPYKVHEVRPALVQSFLDAMSDRPGKQLVALTALRQLEKFALVRDLLAVPIALGCETIKMTGGHIPWTEEQVAIGTRHAGDGFSRVITIAANTGQRESDFVRMRWTDIAEFDGHPGINVTQKKTGRRQWVPFTRALITELATWDRQPGIILRTPAGNPWNARTISSRWARERSGNPELAPLRDIECDGEKRDLVLHGLRGTACVRLLRAGCTTRQIADTVGMSEMMVKKYTRFSDQQQNAMAAVIQLDRTARERAQNTGQKTGS